MRNRSADTFRAQSENCFLDAQNRAKVGDFGSGRFTSSRRRDSAIAAASSGQDNAAPIRHDISTKGSGSWLWMAPEALLQKSIPIDEAPALDTYRCVSIYTPKDSSIERHTIPHLVLAEFKSLTQVCERSFGVLMWEVWTRMTPWNEIGCPLVEFFEELKARVVAGQRPVLPAGCGDAPQGYRELMHSCWVENPVQRPTFSAVLDRLGTVQRSAIPVPRSASV